MPLLLTPVSNFDNATCKQLMQPGASSMDRSVIFKTGISVRQAVARICVRTVDAAPGCISVSEVAFPDKLPVKTGMFSFVLKSLTARYQGLRGPRVDINSFQRSRPAASFSRFMSDDLLLCEAHHSTQGRQCRRGYHEGTGGTELGSQLTQRSGLRPKAVTGAIALSFTFLQKVWEAGSNSCIMGLAVSRKSLHQTYKAFYTHA